MYYSDDHEVDNSGSERYNTKDDLTKSFEAVLKDLPEVLHYIKRLNEHIRKQQTTIIKLFEKLKEFKTKSFNTAAVATQTEDDPYYNYWNGTSYDTSQTYDTSQAAAWGAATVTSTPVVEPAAQESAASTFADEIKQAAETAMQQTGFVYEASSGLYYDYNTGYYYNAELGLYYDGTSGTYFYYNEGTNQFEYHSQASFPEEEALECDEAKPPPPLPTSVPSQRKLPSLKPPPPPLPPKSPPPPAQSSEKKRKEETSSKDEPSERKRRREASPAEGRESPEDGEITDSGGSNDATEIDEKTANSHKEENEDELSDKDRDSPPPTPPGETSSRFPVPLSELVNAWPPCIRIIVQKTGLTNLKVGALFIVTCDGGTLGREEGHAVCIPDINISKHHARFTFDSDDGKYYITDLGSRNGTLLDGQRLSSAKQESDPHLIEHDTKLQLGSTILLCHVHGGNETCGDCEPGVVAALNTSNDSGNEAAPPALLSETKGSQHKQELRRLRKKFGLTSSEAVAEAAGASNPAAGYEDRAHNRRQTVGSLDHNVKTETASVEEHIKSSNKGFKMLSKMGWVHGQGLGKEGTEGMAEPIALGQRPDKAGLGVDLDTLPPPVDDRTKRKADVWKKTQQRYSELPAEKTSDDE